MQIIPPPLQFDGSFAQFFERYVQPNLPSAERVKAFDALLRQHLSSEDPIHVVRYVRGQMRGAICRTADGGRILPTDNAPVWWLHSLLLSETPLPDSAEAMFAAMPHHFFKMSRVQTLNQAGFHAAHILPAKNRDTNWEHWSRDDLARRMLVNIHPCNVFLVAKQGWLRNGERRDIIGWVTNAYRRRYGETMSRFLAECDPGFSLSDRPSDDPPYSYSATVAEAAYVLPSSRPMIKRSLLGRGISLEISTDSSRYLLPHDDLVAWARDHTTALETVSWIDIGIYSWPRATAAMMEFLRRYESPP